MSGKVSQLSQNIHLYIRSWVVPRFFYTAVTAGLPTVYKLAHITDALVSFYWLRAAERIKFKLAVIVYRTTPQYLSDTLRRVADIPSRSRLRSSTSSLLVVCPSRLVTVEERWFASAGPRLWNSLPDDITMAQLLPAFWRKLKTYLFPQSYPDIIL